MSFGVCLFLKGVITKYGGKAHTLGLHRDINVPVIFYHLEDSRSHGNEAVAERGLAQGARPKDQGARPPIVSNSDPSRGSRSTDLKDQV